MDIQMHEAGYANMALYLDKIGIIDRYIYILNGLKNMIDNDWDLELDKL